MWLSLLLLSPVDFLKLLATAFRRLQGKQPPNACPSVSLLPCAAFLFVELNSVCVCHGPRRIADAETREFLDNYIAKKREVAPVRGTVSTNQP